jgi:undecaprenyl-diphosphatase
VGERWLRAVFDRADTVIGTLGIFLVAGLLVGIAGTGAFAVLASEMREGETQAFDDTVIRWMGAHRSPALDSIMVEVTTLGTWTVVAMIVVVAALFLTLSHRKYSAILLIVTTLGGLVLNGVLKLAFNRPRPQMFVPVVQAFSSSFPSGHAMSAAIVYGTVAYLAARLHRRRWARWLVMGFAFVVIVLISFSRMYLGVHYPSDVIAGVLIGLAWASFCMAMLEAVQNIKGRRARRILNEGPVRDGRGS